MTVRHFGEASAFNRREKAAKPDRRLFAWPPQPLSQGAARRAVPAAPGDKRSRCRCAQGLFIQFRHPFSVTLPGLRLREGASGVTEFLVGFRVSSEPTDSSRDSRNDFSGRGDGNFDCSLRGNKRGDPLDDPGSELASYAPWPPEPACRRNPVGW
jgi:hypothetical protein